MAVPHFEVRIDFNKDGDFFGVNEDVTSDVQTLKVASGKNMLKQRADAGVCELLLTNDDHRYSPTNSASPLFPNVLPGPEVWARVAYPYDSFDGTDGATLSGRKPTNDDAFAAWEGDVADFEILANKLRCNQDTTQPSFAIIDFGESDCWVGVDYLMASLNTQSFIGLVFRSSDRAEENYWVVWASESGGFEGLHLTKVEAGFRTTVAEDTTLVWNGGEEKRILVELHGDTIRVYVNEVLRITYADSFNATATKHGIGGSFSDTGHRWNNFGGWRGLFRGRIDTIQPRPELDRKYCYIRAFDDLERLAQHQVYRIAPTAPATAKQVVDRVLDAANASADNRILDDGATLTRETDHEKVLGRDALTELHQVQDDDVGFFYVDGNGFYRYEDSEHRGLDPHTTALKTWHASRQLGDETDIYFDGHNFQWDDGKERVENEGYYIYHKISRVTDVEVWRLNFDDKPRILAGETLSFLAIGEGDVIASPIVPRQTTDFTVNTLKDGTGTDITADVTAALAVGFDGNFRLVELTNNSASTGFITFLRLIATKGTKSAKTAARAEDATSQADVGRRRIQHETLHIDEFEVALDRAKKRIAQRALRRERVLCDMYNATRANLMQMIHRATSDLVKLSYTPMGIDDLFYIEHRSFEARDGGRLVQATWEIQQARIGAVWDNFNWNEDDWG